MLGKFKLLQYLENILVVMRPFKVAQNVSINKLGHAALSVKRFFDWLRHGITQRNGLRHFGFSKNLLCLILTLFKNY